MKGTIIVILLAITAVFIYSSKLSSIDKAKCLVHKTKEVSDIPQSINCAVLDAKDSILEVFE